MVNYSINTPLPPTIRGSDRLSGSRRNVQTQMRPIHSSPYALPGLRKVTVFGPRRQEEHYRGQWQNTGVVYVRRFNVLYLDSTLFQTRLDTPQMSLKNVPQQKTYHRGHCLH
jgi:hypothetical protein